MLEERLKLNVALDIVLLSAAFQRVVFSAQGCYFSAQPR